jgi:hypothetical protein
VRVQAGYRCASCNFDFVPLAGDAAALERWMAPNLREGSFEMTITLHHLITQASEAESRARVLEFAARNGIAPPKGGIAGSFGLVLAAIAVVVVGLVAAAVYLFTR